MISVLALKKPPSWQNLLLSKSGLDDVLGKKNHASKTAGFQTIGISRFRTALVPSDPVQDDVAPSLTYNMLDIQILDLPDFSWFVLQDLLPNLHFVTPIRTVSLVLLMTWTQGCKKPRYSKCLKSELTKVSEIQTFQSSVFRCPG